MFVLLSRNVTTHTLDEQCGVFSSKARVPIQGSAIEEGSSATLDKQPTVCFDTTGQRKVDFMELPDSCPAVLLNPSLCHLFQGALHILSLSITLANGKVHLKCGGFCPNLFSFSRLPLKRLNFFVATDKGFPTPPGNTGPQFKVQKIPKYN